MAFKVGVPSLVNLGAAKQAGLLLEQFQVFFVEDDSAALAL
jgi:hypothetical protein